MSLRVTRALEMVLVGAVFAACDSQPEPFGSPGELLFATTVEDTVFSRDAQTLVFSSVSSPDAR